MSFRRAAKTDTNQTEIVALFRKLGWSVLIVSQLKNCCDIFAAKSGRTIAVEIKDGNKPPSARKLTGGELEFKYSWQGEWQLVESTEDVIRINNGSK